jgi:MFS-type transporter involved in bile tolerance (Atg22 family)
MDGASTIGLVNQWANDLRPAILSLIVLFILGLVILPFVNVKKAIEDTQRVD